MSESESISEPPYIQCLFIVVHKEKIPDDTTANAHLDPSKLLGYALLPRTENFVKYSRNLAVNEIKVISEVEECRCALTTAVKNDEVEIVEALIDESHADPNDPVRILVETQNCKMMGLFFSAPPPRQSSSHAFQIVATPDFSEGISKRGLQSAFEEVNLTILEHLATYRADIRRRHVSGGTLLLLAIQRGNEMLVRLLLKNGAQVDIKTCEGLTPLHVAVKEHANESIVSSILEHGADINAPIVGSHLNGATPLHLALKRKCHTRYSCCSLENPKCSENKGIIRMLLENGAHVDCDSSIGSILELAIESHPDYLALVLSHHPDLNNPKNQAVFRSTIRSYSCNDRGMKIQMLLEYGFQPDKDDAKDPDVFFDAIRSGNVKFVERLLEIGASVHAVTSPFLETPLHVAADSCGEAMICMLLKHGADINAKAPYTELTPLSCAIRAGKFENLKCLLANGANVKYDPFLLHDAIPICPTKDDDVEMIKMLLEHGANIHAPSAEGRQTPVMVALSRGQANLMEIFFQHGARVNPFHREFKEYVVEAIDKRNFQVVLVLAQHGVDIQSVLNRAILTATMERDAELVRRFLVYVDLSSNVFEDASFFDEAVRSHNIEIVIDFLVRGNLNLDLILYGCILDNLEYEIKEYYDNNKDNPNFKGCFERLTVFKDALYTYIVMIDVADLPVNQKCERVVPYGPHESSDLPDRCQAEVAVMKTTKIGDLDVSYYDILNLTAPEIYRLSRNNHFSEILNAKAYTDTFPIYANLIFQQFSKGYTRRSLLERGMKMLDHLFSPKLPFELQEKVLEYLSNQDLMIFANICKLPANDCSEKTDAHT